MRVLTVNAGSTSQKVHLVVDGRATTTSLDAALDASPPDAVAHRVVHGGDRDEAAVVDTTVLADLSALEELAPLHQRPALAALDRCRDRWPAVPQVAAFDTAFHASIPAAARTYALPEPLRGQVRALGFHGLSYSWATRRLRDLAPGARRVVIAHLGGGQSLCATLDGRSVATTMGFSTVDGLVMATRSGSIDPGALLWLAEHTGEDLLDVIERRSGFVGLCGTGDMLEVRRRAMAGDTDAAFALEVWRDRAVGHLGSCLVRLGGLDALAFTGGIGEHDAAAREALATPLGWLGVGLRDEPDLPPGDHEITAPGATVRSFVIACREELELARQTETILAGRPG